MRRKFFSRETEPMRLSISICISVFVSLCLCLYFKKLAQVVVVGIVSLKFIEQMSQQENQIKVDVVVMSLKSTAKNSRLETQIQVVIIVLSLKPVGRLETQAAFLCESLMQDYFFGKPHS